MMYCFFFLWFFSGLFCSAFINREHTVVKRVGEFIGPVRAKQDSPQTAASVKRQWERQLQRKKSAGQGLSGSNHTFFFCRCFSVHDLSTCIDLLSYPSLHPCLTLHSCIHAFMHLCSPESGWGAMAGMANKLRGSPGRDGPARQEHESDDEHPGAFFFPKTCLMDLFYFLFSLPGKSEISVCCFSLRPVSIRIIIFIAFLFCRRRSAETREKTSERTCLCVPIHPRVFIFFLLSDDDR